jgi:hypothetical protein
MSEGFVFKPVTDAELIAELSSASVEYLIANGDVDVKLLDIQLSYSNMSGYSYQVEFEANNSEQGMLEIVFGDTIQIKEV